MNIMNRIYIVNVCEYNGTINSKDYCIRNKIIDSNIAYTLEDAIKNGKDIIESYFYNEIYENISDEEIDNIPDELSDEQIENIISDRLKNNISYLITVNIISGNRRRFNTSNELMEYFNNTIKNISNENLYDFLLSMVTHVDNLYNYKGEYISSYIWEQCPLLDPIWESNVDFNEEDCKKGIYTFEYH